MSVKVLSLLPIGVYRTAKGDMEADYPNIMSFTIARARQGVFMQQNPVFEAGKNVPTVYTWEDFNEMGIPPYDLNARKQMLVVEANSPFPLSTQDPYTAAERTNLGTTFEEEMIQFARAKSSREQLGMNAQRMILFIVAAAAVLFTALLGLIIIDKVWLSDKVVEETVPATKVPDSVLGRADAQALARLPDRMPGKASNI